MVHVAASSRRKTIGFEDTGVAGSTDVKPWSITAFTPGILDLGMEIRKRMLLLLKAPSAGQENGGRRVSSDLHRMRS